MSDGPETLDALLAYLESCDPRRRDEAALRLRDFAESAVDAIFRAVVHPSNRNHCGTLVHVLSVFDCGDRFPELFGLALHGNYEVQCHALSLLQTQSFAVTDQQIHDARQLLSELCEREGLPAEDVSLLREELQTVLSRFAP